MINIDGVKKSAREVVNGIRKLFGSLPCLNNNTVHINKRINNEINKINIVMIIINDIIIGLTILIWGVINAILYPMIMRKRKLKQTVINNAIKSFFNLSEIWIFGLREPINNWVVSREIKTIEIFPIKEFNEGSISNITGMA